MIDSKLFQLRNRPRNRRAFFLLSLVAGSFVGAAMYRTTGSAWAIFVSAVGKFVVSILYLFNGTEERKPSGMNTCLEGNAC